MAVIFREALRAIRRTSVTWAMNVLTLAVALGVSGLFAMLAWKAHTAMHSLRANLAIEVFFESSISSDAASRFVEDSIKPLPSIASLTFTTREQAIKDYAKTSGEDVQAVLGMNPLPASVRILISNPTTQRVREVSNRLRDMNGVAEVRSDLALVELMEQRSHALDRLALVAGSLLMLSALFFAMLSARFILQVRQKTIHTLSMLGATKATIFGPLLLEAALGGLIGGVLAVALLIALRHYALPALGGTMGAPSSDGDYHFILMGLVFAGITFGMLGSFTGWALRRRIE